MSYRFSYRPSFKKDLKAFRKNKPHLKKAKACAEEIMEDPTSGKELKGNLGEFMNYKFSNNPQYRIIYVLYDCCPKEIVDNDQCRFENVEAPEEKPCLGLIDFVFVRTREDCNNLYKQNNKYLKNFLKRP